jgi:cytochrome P450
MVDRKKGGVTTISIREGPLEFDPFSDEYFDDPYDLYHRLRDDAPVLFNEKYGFWALFRFEDVCAAHKDWSTFSSAHGVSLSLLRNADVETIRAYRSIIMMDPPEHDRLRALVSRVFSSRAIGALEPMIREVIASFLSPFDDSDSFDIVADFSALFPVEIISRMLGVPEGERQQIRHWLDLTLHREPGRMDQTPEGDQASLESGMYWYQLTQEKRRHPGDDMITRLTQAEVDRGDGQTTSLGDDEIAGFASLLGGAGAETVTKLIGNAAFLFHRNPDQYQKVKEDREVIPGAVEEILRYYPPSQYQGRFTEKDVVVSGVTIPAGFPTLLVTGSATRDERFFDRPDEFIIDRPRSMSIGFGHGIHTCLGAALARLESRVAIEELSKRWPTFAVDEDRLARVQMSNVAGYSHVPIHRI